MATSTFRNKNEVRPKKKGAAKRARIKNQKKRVMALGVPAETAEKLQADQLRALLKFPNETQKVFAEKEQA